jgi:hypothetical protein
MSLWLRIGTVLLSIGITLMMLSFLITPQMTSDIEIDQGTSYVEVIGFTGPINVRIVESREKNFTFRLLQINSQDSLFQNKSLDDYQEIVDSGETSEYIQFIMLSSPGLYLVVIEPVGNESVTINMEIQHTPPSLFILLSGIAFAGFGALSVTISIRTKSELR